MDKARVLQDLHKYLEVIAKEAKAIIMSVMASDKGVNTRWVSTHWLMEGYLVKLRPMLRMWSL